MIAELLSVAAVFVGGCLLVRTAGLTGWSLPAFGLVAGLSLQLAIGLVQVVTPLPTWPALTLALTAGLPAGWWLVRWRRGHDVGVPVRYAVLAVAALGAAVALLYPANLVKWHTDSFTYLMGGALLADDTYRSVVSTHHVTKRLIGLPLVHAPAQLGGEYYLRSITPLLAVATLAILVWFFLQGVRDRLALGRLDRGQVAAFAVLAGLLLVSNNRFVFSAFYLNAHLLVAVLLLVVAGCGWLLVADGAPPGDRGRAGPGPTGGWLPPPPARALMGLQVLAIPALVVTRPEATVLAGAALLPTLLSPRVPLRHRATAMAVLGLSTAVWQGFMLWVHLRRGAEVPFTVTGPLVLGVLLVLGTGLLGWSPVRRHATRLRWLAEAGLWLALAAFAVRRPEILVDSVDATVQNVVGGAGRWGSSLVVLTALVLGAVVVARSPRLAFLRFPVTTFLPLAFIEAYLRGEAYRVGYADSLSRMFIHIVPLAVLYIVAAYSIAVTARRPRAPSTSPTRGPSTSPTRGVE